MSDDRVDEGTGVRAMFGIGNRVHSHSEVPEPPYSVDVIADLHAGLYPDHVAELLRPRILDDPDAATVWSALQATTAQLNTAPLSSEPPPAFVTERMTQTMRELSSASSTGGQVTWLSRHRGAVVSSLAAAAAVAGIALATTFAFTGDSGDTDSPALDTPSSALTQLPDNSLPDNGLSTATLLSVLGNTEGRGFTDGAAQDRCLDANQVPVGTAVVGSGSIENAGRPAIVILLATGKAGRFDALVVGTDCTTGNPALISRSTIGDK